MRRLVTFWLMSRRWPLTESRLYITGYIGSIRTGNVRTRSHLSLSRAVLMWSCYSDNLTAAAAAAATAAQRTLQPPSPQTQIRPCL